MTLIFSLSLSLARSVGRLFSCFIFLNTHLGRFLAIHTFIYMETERLEELQSEIDCEINFKNRLAFLMSIAAVLFITFAQCARVLIDKRLTYWWCQLADIRFFVRSSHYFMCAFGEEWEEEEKKRYKERKKYNKKECEYLN